MHLAVRCQFPVLLKHFDKLCLVDFYLGPLLLLTDLLQVSDVLVEVLFFLAHSQQCPPFIILTQLYAGVPLSVDSDKFVLEQSNEFPL